MTEDDAKHHWCPFARVADTGMATNRHAGRKKRPDGKESFLRSNAMCLGSVCAAWRWDQILTVDGLPVGQSHTLGFCGLAGKP